MRDVEGGSQSSTARKGCCCQKNLSHARGYCLVQPINQSSNRTALCCRNLRTASCQADRILAGLLSGEEGVQRVWVDDLSPVSYGPTASL